MNLAQKRRIIKIIESDCKIKDRYVNENGSTCAIGALLRDAGVELPDLNSEKNVTVITELPDELKILQEVYGIEAMDAYRIQSINDGSGFPYTERVTPKKRRKKIIEYLDDVYPDSDLLEEEEMELVEL